MIQRCFRIGNCKTRPSSIKVSYIIFIDQSLRELPLRLGPNQILKAIKRKQEVNLTVKEPQLQRRLFGGGFFGEFEWMPDAYDNCNLS